MYMPRFYAEVQKPIQGANTMKTFDNTNTVAIHSKKPSTKQELIANNINLLIEQLEAGHSEALTNYLTAMSRFRTYSFLCGA
jgi:hypothetical protein